MATDYLLAAKMIRQVYMLYTRDVKDGATEMDPLVEMTLRLADAELITGEYFDVLCWIEEYLVGWAEHKGPDESMVQMVADLNEVQRNYTKKLISLVAARAQVKRIIDRTANRIKGVPPLCVSRSVSAKRLIARLRHLGLYASESAEQEASGADQATRGADQATRGFEQMDERTWRRFYLALSHIADRVEDGDGPEDALILVHKLMGGPTTEGGYDA